MLAKTTVKDKGLLPASADEAHVCSQRSGTCKEQDGRREQDQELEQGTGRGNTGEGEEREKEDHGWQDQDHEVASGKSVQVIYIIIISQKLHIFILKYIC